MAQSGSAVLSSFTSELSANIRYNTVVSGTIALTRYGLFLNSNVAEPAPHMSMFPYADSTFTTAELAIGDFWFETSGLKFFDGTHSVTVVASGSTYITASAVTSSYALQTQLNVQGNGTTYITSPQALNFVGDGVNISALNGTASVQMQGGQPASWVWIAQNFT